MERVDGGFRRSVALPGGVDPDRIDATGKKGGLTRVFNRARVTEAKKIEIKTA